MTITKRNKDFKLLLILIILKLFSVSCTKLPIYKSIPIAQLQEDEFLNPIARHFAKNNNLLYGVANDDTALTIRIVFKDPRSAMKIMRGGLTVYFDPSGKKKKTFSLALEKGQNPDLRILFGEQQQNEDYSSRAQNTVNRLNSLYQKAIWFGNINPFVFYRDLTKDPIKYEIYLNSHKDISIDIEMPIAELHLPTAQSLFSIGIETEAISGNNVHQGRKPGMSMQRTRGSRMSSGGRMGGGMDDRKMGGSHGGGMRSRPQE